MNRVQQLYCRDEWPRAVRSTLNLAVTLCCQWTMPSGRRSSGVSPIRCAMKLAQGAALDLLVVEENSA